MPLQNSPGWGLSPGGILLCQGGARIANELGIAEQRAVQRDNGVRVDPRGCQKPGTFTRSGDGNCYESYSFFSAIRLSTTHLSALLQ